MFERENLTRTSVLLISMGLSLWFSLVTPSYLLSLACCVIEFNAIMLYFCNSFPIGRT